MQVTVVNIELTILVPKTFEHLLSKYTPSFVTRGHGVVMVLKDRLQK